jgi:hypothetical protein
MNGAECLGSTKLLGRAMLGFNAVLKSCATLLR